MAASGRSVPRKPGPPAGVIFGCNRASEDECLNGLFGMSSGHWGLVKEILPGTPCFLFNFNTKVRASCPAAVLHKLFAWQPCAAANAATSCGEPLLDAKRGGDSVQLPAASLFSDLICSVHALSSDERLAVLSESALCKAHLQTLLPARSYTCSLPAHLGILFAQPTIHSLRQGRLHDVTAISSCGAVPGADVVSGLCHVRVVGGPHAWQ